MRINGNGRTGRPEAADICTRGAAAGRNNKKPIIDDKLAGRQYVYEYMYGDEIRLCLEKKGRAAFFYED